MAQLRLVETHLNFIFSGLLCPVTCESWFDYPLIQNSSSRDNSQHTHTSGPAAPLRLSHVTTQSRPARA